MNVDRISRMSFSIGLYRPPSEGGRSSLLLKTTENGPWNKCTFCEMYKGQPFACRRVEAIKTDVDHVKAMADELVSISKKTGQDVRMIQELLRALLGTDPYLGRIHIS